ncbi:MAG TPA: hypothetical protein VHO68_10600, partial [Bacteroidales bacterium]|nr:hypothetical protein [Bacteroidales bacterium]
GNGTAFYDDQTNRESLLSLLYVQRRRDMKKPGLAEYEIARLLWIPLEMLEFHVWYLKAKGWIERLDTGLMAITALGVDQVEQGRFQLRIDHMLSAGNNIPEGTEGTSSDVADLPSNPDIQDHNRPDSPDLREFDVPGSLIEIFQHPPNPYCRDGTSWRGAERYAQWYLCPRWNLAAASRNNR